MKRRTAELVRQRKLSPLAPRVVGGAFVVPAGLLSVLSGETSPHDHALDTSRTDRLAVDAVLAAELALGREATEMPHNNKGYDVETRHGDGHLMFIEVKGRVVGAKDFTITSSEIICALNNGDDHILALVEVADDDTTDVRYLYDPFTRREPEPSSAEHKRILDWSVYRDLGDSPH